MRAILSVLFLCFAVLGGRADDLSGLARVDIGQSRIADRWFGGVEIDLALSQGVPFRVFSLNDPPRLVVDFREVDFAGVTPADLLPDVGRVTSVRFGTFRPGWSRLVADLSEPMLPQEVAMPIDESSGRARLTMRLVSVSPDAFAARSGPPPGAGWETAAAAPPEPPPDDSFVVAIDPGHGGIDPGAVRDGIAEKDLMLGIALSLRDVLRRKGGVEVVLTRERDVFVSLPGRVALAHHVGADAFISLHADALSQGQARGATVYTLSDTASDAASAQLAAQHDRADILAGIDLSGTTDEVASVLMDIARVETAPRTAMLADALIEAMDQAGGPMNRRPKREAAFSVLKSADIPSVLVEVGFLSDPRDLENLRDPVWRAVMVDALAEGIMAWRQSDLAQRPLVRQ